MRILGISCDYHDAAASLVIDGRVVAAAEEERFTRLKHDSSLPEHAIASVLAIGDIDASELDAVVLHEKPLAVISRVLAARQRRGPRALGAFRREMPVLLRRNLFISYRVDTYLRRLGAVDPPRLSYCEHHLSHAAAAFLPSPFERAAVLTIDGIGEWATATIGHGVRHRLDLLEEQRYPNSLGLLYSLATQWCGFEANDGEYKVMGLAPFGEPTFREALGSIVELDEDGSIAVDPAAVGWWSRPTAELDRLNELFGPPRQPGAPLTRRDQDLARSVQDFAEDAVLRMGAHAHALTGETAVCLAGGVALNCVANGRLLREGPFDDVWVQPAAGDAGSAVGAALWYWHDELGMPRGTASPSAAAVTAYVDRGVRGGDGCDDERAIEPTLDDGMRCGQLGPSFDADRIDEWLVDLDIEHRRVIDVGERCALVAEMLAGGAIVGWFEGRMEFGPRALGHRSILADPRSPTVQRDINLRVKGRESFRPFAPAVLWEQAHQWFELDRPSPYMLRTCQVAADKLLPVGSEPVDVIERVQVARSLIPACTHVDGSARVQTVHRGDNPLFHRLISAFADLTDCPVLLNTSFNRAGEPVVCTPEDALDAARAAQLDVLVLEDSVIHLRSAGTPGTGR